MNLIDRTLEQLKVLNADEVIQTLGRIYDEPIDRNSLSLYPQYIQDTIFLIDLDTELSMQGISGLLENSTGAFIPNMITALKNIRANNEADILHAVYERHKINSSDEEIDVLSDKLYLYTGFDIWPLLEAYVEREMCV
jgi:hypothetical protein